MKERSAPKALVAVAAVLGFSSLATPYAHGWANFRVGAYLQNYEFPPDREAVNEALFGRTPGTELFGLSDFTNQVRQATESSDFYYKAQQSHTDYEVPVFTARHWVEDKGYMERDILMKLSFEGEYNILEFYEKPAKGSSESYSIAFRCTNSGIVKGTVAMSYKKTDGGYGLTFEMPLEFERPYTWNMFDNNESPPQLMPVPFSNVDIYEQMFGFNMYMQNAGPPGSDQAYNLNKFLSDIGRTYRRIIDAYLEAKRMD